MNYNKLKDYICSNNKEIDRQLNPYLYENKVDTSMGNPLGEHHLRQFCESIVFQGEFIFFPKSKLIPKGILEIVTKIDNTKDFNSQEDSVYEDLLDYLTNL